MCKRKQSSDFMSPFIVKMSVPNNLKRVTHKIGYFVEFFKKTCWNTGLCVKVKLLLRLKVSPHDHFGPLFQIEDQSCRNIPKWKKRKRK